jgi:hypothetical protein
MQFQSALYLFIESIFLKEQISSLYVTLCICASTERHTQICASTERHTQKIRRHKPLINRPEGNWTDHSAS